MLFSSQDRSPDLDAFAALADNPCPSSPRWMRALTKAWGNAGFRAGRGYLRRIAESTAETNAPILECGSGLSTILMGMLTADRDVPLLALEHTAPWRDRVQSVLDALGYQHVEVRHCPIVDYGLYDWYDFGEHLPAGIKLVVCDGPPGRDTRGGRYGLLPQAGPFFHPDCVILLDDTHRKGEQRVMKTWNRRTPLNIQHFGTLFRYAEMTAA